MNNPFITRRQWLIALVLACLFYAVYLLTFSGMQYSGDELFIIDTVDGLAIHHTVELHQTAYQRPPQTSDVEPGQPLLAAPLYWLAYQVPWLGTIHVLMQFNLLVTALLGALFFFFALEQGYSERTSLVGALLLGFTTILWPYTQTFFREPLTTLNLFAAAYLTLRWRRALNQGARRHWGWLAGALLLLALALLSKESALLFVPYLILLALPGRETLTRHRRALLIAALGLLALGVILAVALFLLQSRLGFSVSRYQLGVRIQSLLGGLSFLPTGLAGYLLSPGKSIFMYSPTLVLALAGPFLLPVKRWREAWLPLVTMLVFAAMYAMIRQVNWHGGSGWGARYMLPILPFLMSAALPALDFILSHPRWWPRVLLAVLVLAGLAVQVSGVYVYLHDYYLYQLRQTGIPPFFPEILWSLRWSQVIGSLLYIPLAAPDILWFAQPQPLWGVGGLLMAAALSLGVLLFWLVRSPQVAPAQRVVSLAAPFLLLGVAVIALAQGYHDTRYKGDFPELLALIEYASHNIPAGDQIVLSSPLYARAFMNYYKGPAIWYSLPDAPGERPSPEQEPRVISENVDELVGAQSVTLLDDLILGRLSNAHPIWLVAEGSSFLEWSVRPAERFLAAYSSPVDEVFFAPQARLVRFLPLRIFPQNVPRHPLTARFADLFLLRGYDAFVPGSPTMEELQGYYAAGQPHSGMQHAEFEVLHPGQVVGFSLQWEVLAQPDQDYVFPLYLIGPEGTVVLQQDRAPVYGFEHTSRWRPGELYRDNFGFILPPDLPPGQYQVWAAVYSWPALERLPVSGPDAGGPDYALVTTLIVAPSSAE